MNQGDYGVTLPFTVTGTEFQENDTFLFQILKTGGTVLEKSFNNLSEDLTKFAFSLSFTKDESNKLNKGAYTYNLIHIRNEDALRNTVISNEDFNVGDAA